MKLGKNGLIYGSFNPLHCNHVRLIQEGFLHFDVLHIFVRSEGIKDLVDYSEKKVWLETLGQELSRDLRVYPFVFPEGSIREDHRIDLPRIFCYTEKKIGVRADGLITGGDKADWVESLSKAFPDREFVMIPENELNMVDFTADPDSFQEYVPEYVYRTLKKR